MEVKSVRRGIEEMKGRRGPRERAGMGSQTDKVRTTKLISYYVVQTPTEPLKGHRRKNNDKIDVKKKTTNKTVIGER